jgi:hypothetical protein
LVEDFLTSLEIEPSIIKELAYQGESYGAKQRDSSGIRQTTKPRHWWLRLQKRTGRYGEAKFEEYHEE